MKKYEYEIAYKIISRLYMGDISDAVTDCLQQPTERSISRPEVKIFWKTKGSPFFERGEYHQCLVKVEEVTYE